MSDCGTPCTFWQDCVLGALFGAGCILLTLAGVHLIEYVWVTALEVQ